MMQENNYKSSGKIIQSLNIGILNNQNIQQNDTDISSSMQLDAFVQQHLLSNRVSTNVSKNCSPVRYHHPIIQSPLIKQQQQQLKLEQEQYRQQQCNTALGISSSKNIHDIQSNNIITSKSPCNENKSVKEKLNQKENQQHFNSVIDNKSIDNLIQSPSKNNDKQTEYQSFTQSPQNNKNGSPQQIQIYHSRNQLRNFEDSSSYHNNIANQQINHYNSLSHNVSQQQQINDSFCNSQQQSPKKNKIIDNNKYHSSNTKQQNKQQSSKKNNKSIINDENSQQQTARKSVVLEQENQQLKSQIEMLKAALLGLCQNQKIQIPELMPLINNNNDMINNAKTQDPFQILNDNNNDMDIKQISQIVNDFTNNQQIIENPVVSNNANIPQSQLENQNNNINITQGSFCSSPSKSVNRRKRNQRQQSSPKKKDMSIDNSIHKQKPQKRNQDLCVDLPLQIQYKRQRINNTVMDDTLACLDNSITDKNNLSITNINDLSQLAHNQQQPQQLSFNNGYEQNNNITYNDNENNINQSAYSDNICNDTFSSPQKVRQDTQNYNEDSIMMGPQITQPYDIELENQEQLTSQCQFADQIQTMHNQSQLQLKYAKMLEELEQDEILSNKNSNKSNDINKDNNNNNNILEYYSPTDVINGGDANNQNSQQFSSDIVQTKDTATFLGSQGMNQNSDCMMNTQTAQTYDQNEDVNLQEQINLEIPLINNKMMETLRSNKYEYEQFYENELHQLKTELEMFEQEEKKLLTLITIQPSPSEDCQQQIEVQRSPEKKSQKILKKSFTLQEDSSLKVQKRNFDIEQLDSQSSILNNLREAFLELKDVLQEQNDDNLIRPIKILSPTICDQQLENKQEQTCQEQQYINGYLATDNSDICNQIADNYNDAYNVTSPAKFPLMTSQSILFSNEKQQQCDNQSLFSSTIKKSPLIDQTSFIFKMQNEYSNFKSSQKNLNEFYNPLVINPTSVKNKNQMNSCVKVDKRSFVGKLDKSPSQVSLQNYKYNIDNDQNSKSTTTIRENSNLRSESRLRKQQQQTLNKLKMSSSKLDALYNNNNIYEQIPIDNQINIENVEVPTMETIEILSKRKSLAIGLKQQEEPLSSDDEMNSKSQTQIDTIRSRSLSQQSSALRIIRPILMEQPCFDSKQQEQHQANKHNNNNGDNDEVRIEIINDSDRYHHKTQDNTQNNTCKNGNQQQKQYLSEYSPSNVNYQSYFDGDCSTGLMRDRQHVQTLIEETQKHVRTTHDKFFGNYSKEKSETLKYQRQESIKRAEEMLNELIRDKSYESRRPSYLGSPKRDLQQNSINNFEITPKRIFKDINNKLQSIVQQSKEFNDLSFQQQNNINESKDSSIKNQLTSDLLPTISNTNNNLRESTRDSIYSQGGPINVEVINLQISPEKSQVDYHQEFSNCVSPYAGSAQVDMKLQQFDAFEQTYGSATGSINDQQSMKQGDVYQTIEHEYYICSQNKRDNSQFNLSTPSQYDQAYGQSQFSNQKIEQKMVSPFSENDNLPMLEPQIINRRKSLENTIVSNSKMYQANQQSNPRRRTLQLKKGGFNNNNNINSKNKITTIDPSTYNSKSETNQTVISHSKHLVNNKNVHVSQQSNYQQFQSNSQSCEKNKRKTLALSKTVENLSRFNDESSHRLGNNQTSMVVLSSQVQNNKSKVIEEPTIIAHPNKMSTIDAEAFYMERSKSVVKRREELQRKKQQEIQQKIEAKNMRIEHLKSTRNSQLNTSNGRIGNNSSQRYGGNCQNQSHADINGNAIGMLGSNNNNCLSQTQYHTKQQSTDSRNMTPIKASHDKSQRMSHLGVKQYESITNNSTHLNNANAQNSGLKQQGLTRTKSLGKCQIKFEKRIGMQQDTHQSNLLKHSIVTSAHKNDHLYNQTILLSVQTPSNNSNFSDIKSLSQINQGALSSKSVQNISVLPSASQSHSINSKMTSECSSYRKQSNNATETQQNQQILAQNNRQNKVNSQQVGGNNNTLKQSIINRTMRLGQQRPKEYVQLKQEQKMKLTMLNTIENTSNQTQASTTIANQTHMNQTAQSSSSVIINCKQQNTSLQQPSILNKSKALARQHLINNMNQVLSDNTSKQQQQKQLSISKSASKLTSLPNNNQSAMNSIQANHAHSNQVGSSNYNTQQQPQRIRPVTVIEYSNHGQQSNREKIVCQTSDKKKNNPNTTTTYRYVEDLSSQLQSIIGGKDTNRFDTYMKHENQGKDRKDCINCQRLLSKGLSTDFCLEHYGTPRCIDD